jgi:hypothetical protein
MAKPKLTKRAGSRNAKSKRKIPAILRKPIVWKYLPGRAPTILNDGPVQVDEEYTKKQLADRLTAMSAFLGCEPDAWLKDPQKLLLVLARYVFPGFEMVFFGKAERDANKKLYPLNGVLIRWYQRSVQLRLAGAKLQDAVQQASRETPEMRNLTEGYVEEHWKKARKTPIIRMSERVIKERGLSAGYRFILGFATDVLAEPVKRGTKAEG